MRCALSIGTLDAEVARATEPGAPPPAQRVEAVRRLAEAGVPSGVLVAPVLPGISDGQEQLERVDARGRRGRRRRRALAAPAPAAGGQGGLHAVARATTGPTSSPDYERRYDTASGYLPSRDQRAHSERIRRIVQEAGGALSRRRGR